MSKANVTEMALEIRLLEESDVEPVGGALEEIGWKQRRPTLRRYLSEQDDGRCTMLIALAEDVFAGYLAVDWRSAYPSLQRDGVPKIADFNVLPQFRRREIDTRLMDDAGHPLPNETP